MSRLSKNRGKGSMNLLHLQYFMAVCHMGSTTKAAAQLSISQPAVSAAIRELENEFGVFLFDRVGKRLQITDAGKLLYDHAKELLEKAESTTQIMNDVAQKRKRLHIGIAPMLAALILPELFCEYRNKYPAVDFSITECGRRDLFQKLDSRELDMIICSKDPERDSGYRKLKLMQLEFGICLDPDHPLANKDQINISELKNEPLACFSMGFHHVNTVEKLFAAEGLKPNIIFQTSQISTMLEMVSRGLVSCFMYTALQRHRPDLRFLPMTGKGVSREGIQVNLYWRKNEYLYSDMKNLIKCIQSLHFDTQLNSDASDPSKLPVTDTDRAPNAPSRSTGT